MVPGMPTALEWWGPEPLLLHPDLVHYRASLKPLHASEITRQKPFSSSTDPQPHLYKKRLGVTWLQLNLLVRRRNIYPGL